MDTTVIIEMTQNQVEACSLIDEKAYNETVAIKELDQAKIFTVNPEEEHTQRLNPQLLQQLAPMGHALRQLFYLEPTLINLNHGSFGALPKVVHQA